MSWDVVIFNFNGAEPPDEMLNIEGRRPSPLGDAKSVRDKISQSIAAVDWSDPAWGSLETTDFAIEFHIQEEGVVESFMIYVYGGGNPIAIIQKICVDNGWQALETSGSWLDLNSPSDEGWKSFQRFRDQVIKKY
jgi:hypothetical protein